MKKLLVFAVMFGILISTVSFILAVDQGLEVDVGEDIHLVITPTTVDFGTVVPGLGKTAVNGPITFDAAGSNVDVTVAVTAVTGFPFAGSTLLLDGDSTPVGLSWLLDCVLASNVCTYSVASTVPTLDIPVGASQGTHVGAITYTVTGAAPA